MTITIRKGDLRATVRADADEAFDALAALKVVFFDEDDDEGEDDGDEGEGESAFSNVPAVRIRPLGRHS